MGSKTTYEVGVIGLEAAQALDPNDFPHPIYSDRGGNKVYLVAVTGIKKAKEVCMWGTFGKGGVEHCHGVEGCPQHPLVWKRLVDCDSEHLRAILRTQRQLRHTDYPTIINAILADRGEPTIRGVS